MFLKSAISAPVLLSLAFHLCLTFLELHEWLHHLGFIITHTQHASPEGSPTGGQESLLLGLFEAGMTCKLNRLGINKM
jgi:hypothetical protein